MNITDPKIYVKSNWQPRPQPNEQFESCLNTFKNNLTLHQNMHIQRTRKASNLSNHQKHILKLLSNNNDFVILPTDKNLGPCILERSTYIKYVLEEHLEDGKTYIQLNENTALNNIQAVQKRSNHLLSYKFRKQVDSEEMAYFVKSKIR